MDAAHGQSRWPAFAVSAVLIITAAIYLPTLGFGFVTDDRTLLASLPAWSWRSIPALFTHHYWALINTSDASVPAYYRPVLALSNMLIYGFAGGSAVIWHAVAVLLHVAVTYLVYRVALELTADRVIALTAALLFGVHPAHVEAVAWTSGISESIEAAFIAGAFLCWRRRSRAIWMCAAVGLYCAALLTKETAVVFPLLLVADAYVAGRGHQPSRRIVPSLAAASPFFAAVAVYLAVRRLVLGAVMTRLLTAPAASIERTWPVVALFYARHLVWPIHLSYIYPLALQTTVTAAVVLAVAVLAAAICALLVFSTGAPGVLIATLWMVAFIVPVFNLSGMTDLGIVHDRYLYLPSIGFCILCAIALRFLRIRYPAMAVAVVAVVASAWSVIAVAECRPWRSETTLFTRVLQISPGDRRAVGPLAVALETSGHCAEAIQLAEPELLRRDDASLRIALGACYLQQQQFADAENQFRHAAALKPNAVVPALMAALALVSEQRFSDADATLNAIAAKHGADWPGFHLLRGRILEAKADWAGAAAEYRKELALNPESEQAQAGLDEVELRTPRP